MLSFHVDAYMFLSQLLGKEKEIVELTENIDQLIQEMGQKSSEYHQKCTDLEEEKKVLEEKVHRLESESRKMQLGVEDMQDIVKRTNKQLPEISAEKKALQERINELREEVSRHHDHPLSLFQNNLNPFLSFVHAPFPPQFHAQKTREEELLEDIRNSKAIIEVWKAESPSNAQTPFPCLSYIYICMYVCIFTHTYTLDLCIFCPSSELCGNDEESRRRKSANGF
jgi:chromosome segregation ATPase